MKKLVYSLMAVSVPLGALILWGSGRCSETPDATELCGYKVIATYPHDRNAFTQGLAFEDGSLYESTGLYGRSSLRKVRLKTGDVLQQRTLGDRYFGEGITVCGEKIIQLTWQSNTGFVYDRESFALLREFSFPTEGWGITCDGKQLIISDGSAELYFVDPQTFEQIGQIKVSDEQGPVTGINELEYIKGRIYANIYPTDQIAVIDPRAGRVVCRIDLSDLRKSQPPLPANAVLNGVAYDKEKDRLFVTGKLWAGLYEIKLTQPNP